MKAPKRKRKWIRPSPLKPCERCQHPELVLLVTRVGLLCVLCARVERHA